MALESKSIVAMRTAMCYFEASPKRCTGGGWLATDTGWVNSKIQMQRRPLATEPDREKVTQTIIRYLARLTIKQLRIVLQTVYEFAKVSTEK